MSDLTPDERRRIDQLGRKITTGIDTALSGLTARRKRMEARRRAEHAAAVNDVEAMMLAERIRTMADAERWRLFLAEGGTVPGAVDLAQRVNRFLQARVQHLEASRDA